MLSKQQFFKYVEELTELHRKRDLLEELGVDACDFFDNFYYLSDLVINSNFDVIGCDTFFAWLYEDKRTAKDSTGTYVLEDLESLWNFLTKHFNYEPAEEISNIY